MWFFWIPNTRMMKQKRCLYEAAPRRVAAKLAKLKNRKVRRVLLKFVQGNAKQNDFKSLLFDTELINIKITCTGPSRSMWVVRLVSDLSLAANLCYWYCTVLHCVCPSLAANSATGTVLHCVCPGLWRYALNSATRQPLHCVYVCRGLWRNAVNSAPLLHCVCPGLWQYGVNSAPLLHSSLTICNEDGCKSE